ncbi:MAG: hypothetical protein RQ753_03750 [Desulfurivibrionaceae bacterium]|nr:hypothetical protein [Desulfobulbales bacterium]MDT8334790.1 hypothetical protein [Desulfurivibrionaceae bacterium]
MIARFKPDVSIKTRLFMAALLWSCIGLMLLWRGGSVVVAQDREWLLPVALLLGALKSRAILDRVAGKNIDRIIARGEFSCLGGIYSWKTWLLVAVMILSGRLLRISPLQAWLLGFIYVTVGWSLLWSSRKAWFRLRVIGGPAVSGSSGEHDNGKR